MSSSPAPASRSRSSSGLNPPGGVQNDGGRLLNPMAKEFVPCLPGDCKKPGSSRSNTKVANEASHRRSNPNSRGMKNNRHDANKHVAVHATPKGKGAAKHNAEDQHKTSNENRHLGKVQDHHTTSNEDKHLSKVRYDPIAKPQFRPSTQHKHPYRKQAYDKDLFLQANFRFLVSDFGNYMENTVDPDKMLEWEDIAAVELIAASPVQCPICLDEYPLCPQITSCGHIFCFPCILRYLMIEGSKPAEHWKKCPLCFSMICLKELRTVLIHQVKRCGVGDEIEFTLLTRAKDFVIPLPNNQSGWALAYSEDGQCDLFSKFTLTSDMDKTTNRAVSELKTWAEAAQHGGNEDLERLPYIFASMDELMSRKVAWDKHRILAFESNPPVKQRMVAKPKQDKMKVPEVVKTDKKEAEVVKTDKKEPMVRVNPFTDEEELVDPEPDKTEASENLDVAKPEEFYSFYQGTDGQLIILHPFNMKCITRHHGGYKNLPLKIRGKVYELETFIQTEASRRRYRYLSHFPLTSVIQLCEIDLSKSLPSSALIPFAEELQVRETRRKRKTQKEKQLKEAEERREAAAKPPSPADYVAIMGVLHDRMYPITPDFKNELVPAVPVAVSPPVDSRKLFSNVAKMGFAAGHDAPDLIGPSSSTNGPSTSSPWKAAATGGTRSFADVIQKEKETSQSSGCPLVGSSLPSSKKNQKASRLLLSTSGRRY